MVVIDGQKYACDRCIRGHRVSHCNHTDKALTRIKPKGRPSSHCTHCKDSRRLKNTHVKCTCGKNGSAGCQCGVSKECTCTSKAKQRQASVVSANDDEPKTPQYPDYIPAGEYMNVLATASEGPQEPLFWPVNDPVKNEHMASADYFGEPVVATASPYDDWNRRPGHKPIDTYYGSVGLTKDHRNDSFHSMRRPSLPHQLSTTPSEYFPPDHWSRRKSSSGSTSSAQSIIIASGYPDTGEGFDDPVNSMHSSYGAPLERLQETADEEFWNFMYGNGNDRHHHGQMEGSASPTAARLQQQPARPPAPEARHEELRRAVDELTEGVSLGAKINYLY